MADDLRMPGGSPDGSGSDSTQRLYDALRRSPVRRSREGRVLGGVATGVAHHFGLDPVLVRVAFVVLGIAVGVGLTVYLLAWFLLPDERGTLAVERAVRDHDGGSITLGVFTLLSMFNAPSNSSGWWATLISLLMLGAIVYLAVRHHRRRTSEGADGRDGSRPATGWSTPPAGMPGAANHGSPTRGGDTSVFDPVTGRWVPAVQPYGRAGNPTAGSAGFTTTPPVVNQPPQQPRSWPAAGAQPYAPQPYASQPCAPQHYESQSASQPLSQPSAQPLSQPSAAPAPPTTPAAPLPRPARRGLGAGATTLLLLAAAGLGVGAAWLTPSLVATASALVVGMSAALAFLSLAAAVVALRGRRATVLAMAIVILLPFAAGVANVQRGDSGVSIEIGVR